MDKKIKRRVFILTGVAVVPVGTLFLFSRLPPSVKMLLGNFSIIPRRVPLLVEQQFTWKGSDFNSGGFKSVDVNQLPLPTFREAPNCTAALSNIIGPCDSDQSPLRSDITEGKVGLPTRISLKVVDAANCAPIQDAEVQIWHTNPKGIYSGKDVSTECTFDDPEAKSSFAFRGKQISGAYGVVNFLTVYPGWYSGRCVHTHIRVLVAGKELLVTQLFFEDLLSDMVYTEHPDYVGRAPRDTRNETDNWSPRAHLNAHMFDFTRLDAGVLQASFTIGVEI